VAFIWRIADDCLRDVYVRGKYRDVIDRAGRRSPPGRRDASARGGDFAKDYEIVARKIRRLRAVEALARISDDVLAS